MDFSSKRHIILFILMFISSAQALQERSTPMYLASKFCLGKNYTANGTYGTNLKLLLSSLSTTFTNIRTIPRHGYLNITIGRNPNTVYGSLHCRQDIELAICLVCVQIATERVMQDSGCPNKKRAIMFYNGCVLRYSDENYFSILNEEPSTVITYLDNRRITNQVQYIDIVTRLLDELVFEAVHNTSVSPSFYAARSANYPRFSQVYAMVQCTPDLTPSLCNTCLRSALMRLPSDAQGARIFFPSCSLIFEYDPSYEIYIHRIQARVPTLQASHPTLQAPRNTNQTSVPILQASPPTNSNAKDSSELVIGITIPLVTTALVLSSIATWWFCSHKRKKINNNHFVMDPDFQRVESLLFNFNILSAATNNFSEDNKLGQGGFGPVYKVYMQRFLSIFFFFFFDR
ncbi:hypothetical protein MKW92_047991 [Papaver armeniacum]|nr:hypothetical protein MKW92_047991 [Papaver armeniacum]